LSSEIKSRLDSEYYWHATVSLGLDQVAAHSAGRVFIMGELTGKGALDLPADGHLTVSQAILQMGGPTDDSNLKHVRVMRPSANAKGYIEVNVAAVLKGDASKDLVLQPGDTVNVPKNLFGIKF
jgi:protein involved in polysaccharide export with SLBB domain